MPCRVKSRVKWFLIMSFSTFGVRWLLDVRDVPSILVLVSAREREGHRAKVPGSELVRVLLTDSLQGANWPESDKAVNPARDS